MNLWYLLLLALMVAGPRLSVANGRDRRALVIEAFNDALAAAHLTPKDAQFYMDLDKSQYSRCLDPHGDLQLSAFKIALLPFDFQAHYMAKYMFLVVRESAKEMGESVRELKRA